MAPHATDPGHTLVSPGSVASGPGRSAAPRRWYAVVLVGLLLAVLVRAFVVETFFVPDAGMAPTLLPGDRVVVAKLSGAPAVGDVVVVDVSEAFPGPSRATHTDDGTLGSVLAVVANALGVRNGSRAIVARVVARGGDEVTCREGRIEVGGTPVSSEVAALDCDGFSLRVPTGSVWVLGDNPPAAFDSLAHARDAARGLVPEQDVVGRVLLRVWPLTTVAAR